VAGLIALTRGFGDMNRQSITSVECSVNLLKHAWSTRNAGAVKFEMSVRIVFQSQGSFGVDSRANQIDKEPHAGEAERGYTDWYSCRI
jgi:hypothetical protein